MKKSSISPKHLKALRERKGWSQEKLAEKSSLTARRVSALEKEGLEQISVQQKTFKGLCNALGERPEVLSGEVPLPPLSKSQNVLIKFHPQTRLNLDLLNKRFGITIDDVINIAPLLIVGAAEETLSRQAQDLRKDVEAFEQAAHDAYPAPPDYYERISSLGLCEPTEGDEGFFIDEYIEAKEAALSSRDIFETGLRDYYAEYWERPNPFATYLDEESVRNQTGEIHKAFHSVYAYFPGNKVPQYSICSDELKQITCGSIDAERALVKGITTVSEIPDDLWEPRNSGRRVIWLEEKYREAETARVAEESELTEHLEEFLSPPEHDCT
jgi:transcriptional regulator with XRE-family HTH domain